MTPSISPSRGGGKLFFVLAHNMRSLHNVGSIFRTAECFGASKIYLTGYTGTPPHPKIAKTALGAEKLVAWEYKKSAAAIIKALHRTHPALQVLGLENNLPKRLQKKIIKLNAYRPRFPLLLILGHETTGIPKSLLQYCVQFIEIPMAGLKESLNVSVAFGAAAYQISHAQSAVITI